MSRIALTDLGPGARRLLAACAVLGERFTFSELFTILGDPAENGTHRFHEILGLQSLRQHGWLAVEDPTRPDHWRFTDVDARSEVLAALDAAEAARLESRIAASALGSV